MPWAKAILAWFGFAVLAVLMGTLRVRLLQPLVGPAAAHIIGTLAVCALFFVLIVQFVRWAKLRHIGIVLSLGALWTTLTVVFEFGFGHYVMGHPWERLLSDYNIWAGQIWVLVLLTMLLGPLMAAWLVGRTGNRL